MIAVIMVIIPAVKGSLGYRVFALLPGLGSGLHNPHPSHGPGSKIPFLSWKCSRCPKYPINKCFVCPWFASLTIFEHDEFQGVKRGIC